VSRARVILVGGFLGAGKTTLIAKAVERLVRSGKRVGVITNDQAANLVDTALLKGITDSVQEVAGGCFCCRFDDLTAAMDRIAAAWMPDVIIGEPVGSCTDLSATVIQPMKRFRPDYYQVGPFSVVVDVKQVRALERLRKSMRNSESARFPKSVMYIYEKQLEEADLIVLNKVDLLTGEELAELEATFKREFAKSPVFTVSGLQSIGVDDWLDHVLRSDDAGETIAHVNYDEYAEGEAALGWLNAVFHLRSGGGIDCHAFCLNFLIRVQKAFRELSAEVAHLKMYITAGPDTLVANLTSNDCEPSLRGMARSLVEEATVLLNVRVRLNPLQLREITEKCIYETAGPEVRVTTEDLQSFAPSRPTPTHRFEEVIASVSRPAR
jgi:G3E family GTPase